MQINLGEKIKELRKKDGRKQEDLAKALGVTAQAVSRWEAGTCYPDMNLIPAIANYFHISIDSLFGYQNDREGKINEYTKEALRRMFDEEDITETIQYLRECLEEFPGEAKLKTHLASALTAKGFEETTPNNPYLEEAAAIYEDLSKQDPEVIGSLLHVYTHMGELEKAENKACAQPLIMYSREVLLASHHEFKKAAQYRGEAILSLLHTLEFITEQAISWNDAIKHTQEATEILEALYALYEKIFHGKDYGMFHSDLCMLNLSCADNYATLKDYERSCAALDRAYTHYREYKKIMDISMQGIPQTPHYESPLLSEVKGSILNFVVCKPEYLTSIINSYPAKIKKKVLSNPKYADFLTK